MSAPPQPKRGANRMSLVEAPTPAAPAPARQRCVRRPLYGRRRAVSRSGSTMRIFLAVFAMASLLTAGGAEAAGRGYAGDDPQRTGRQPETATPAKPDCVAPLAPSTPLGNSRAAGLAAIR